jgi:hypothetical protein
MKRIRIAQAESSNWKTEVRKYLVAYLTNHHSVTGIAPSELMINRKLRTKLPEICVVEDDGLYLDDEIRDRNLFAKSKNKRCIDSKRNASERDLKTGDSVLVRQPYQNKLSTPFISTPHKLIEKTGNKCVVESPEGVTYQRNSTHVKK